MDDDRLRTLARAQHGLVSRRQVLDLGGTDTLISRRVSAGLWERARRGVVIVGAAPRTWEQDVMAATLAAGPGVFAAERTALRLWGFVPRSGRIQLVTEHHRRIELEGIELRRTTCLPPTDRAVLRGIPVTSVARTLVDASAGQHPSVVGRWVDDAMRRLNLDLAELRGSLGRLSGPGRREPVQLRVALVDRDPRYQPGHSQLEADALLAIIRARLPMPVQQHRVVRLDGSLAFIDLAYPEAMVAIELDGFDPHAGREVFDHDRARGNDLVLLDWKVLHFTSTTQTATFIRTLTAALARAGHPTSVDQ